MSLKEVVVCKFTGCNQVYNDPRILPCGKRTCAAHIEAMMMLVKDDETPNDDARCQMIKCYFCDEIHSFPENGKGFPVDENIAHLLNISYSCEHGAAKKSFNDATLLLDKLNKFDTEDYVIDYFEQVEADIVLEKEAHLQKVHAHYQKLVDRVHVRKSRCLHNLKTNKKLAIELEAIYASLYEHKRKLESENFGFLLKTLDGREAKWRSIQSECGRLMADVNSLSDELKERIIADQKTEFKASECDTRIESLCGHLNQGPIDSTIITNCEMKRQLAELCEFNVDALTLIYRASQDGFEAASFHDKCDHQLRTLTIIETTKGYIFGAYTAVAWDSSNTFKADPDAFIFSLKNATSKPMRIPVKAADELSIYCYSFNGPIFGSGHDILIADNSNVEATSASNLGQSYNFSHFPHGTPEAKSFLAGSYNFQTCEIEVFQLS